MLQVGRTDSRTDGQPSLTTFREAEKTQMRIPVPPDAHAGILLLSLQQGGAASPARGSVGREQASPGAGKRSRWSLRCARAWGEPAGAALGRYRSSPEEDGELKACPAQHPFRVTVQDVPEPKAFLPDSSRLSDRCSGRVHPPPRTAATAGALSPRHPRGREVSGVPWVTPTEETSPKFLGERHHAWHRDEPRALCLCPACSVPSGMWCHPDTGPEPAAGRWREKLLVKKKIKNKNHARP